MKMTDFNINMTQYNRGDIITGTIVMIGKYEVVVSLGGLKEGVFPKSELDSAFKLGDAILVMVTGKIDEKGCLVVTHAGVNKALADKEKLKNLKVGSELTFKSSEITSSGVVGEFMGYRVFLPYSQCTAQEFANKSDLSGREITAIVIELNNLKKSIVCSTKLLLNDKIEHIEEGQIIEGTVIKLEDKYALILLDNGSKAKLSIRNASYTHIDSLTEILELNKKYTFKVLDVNTDFSRVDVGLKQLKTNPQEELFNSLNLDDEVEGEVVKIFKIGALIKLDNGLTALAITKENTDRSNVATHYIYKLHSRVKGYISNIDKENYKLNIITNKDKKA